MVTFLVPGWKMARYMIRRHGSSLDDLSAVADGTTEHHAEDHPDDLQRGELIFRQHVSSPPSPPKKVSFQHLTHHDTSDANAHIPNDVKFVIKEVLDLRFTVLQSKVMSHEVRDGYKTIC